ncbi:MAG: hypothetical protein IJO27_01180 [Bacilli bacterium]|nr:hypothetical protein [Bacilli bacterium]
MKKEYQLDQLIKAFIAISNENECKDFLNDICTFQELEKMAQRLEAAQLLLEGRTYEQVIQETNISSTTLSRVSRCIRYGNNGYKNILDKLNKK